MIFVIWILYFASLFLVGLLRQTLNGFGIELGMLPTILIHGALFAGWYFLVDFLRKRILKQPVAPKKRTVGEKKSNNNLIYAVVTVGFTAMQALQSNGMLPAAISGYLVPVCAYIVLAISLNLVVGISGELSLGHAGFMAIGSYTAILTMIGLQDLIADMYIRLILSLIFGGLAAGIAGFLIGIPILRLRGDYLAIVTLAFGEIIRKLIGQLYIGRNENGFHFAFMDATEMKKIDGIEVILNGSQSTMTISDRFDRAPISLFVVGILLVLFTIFVVLNLINSKEGRAIKATRDNRIAAESVGINVTTFKMKAFVTGAVFAGMAGALFAVFYRFVSFDQFEFTESINILTYVVLGGLGNMLGSVISTTILYVLPELMKGIGNYLPGGLGWVVSFVEDYRPILYAVVLILLMLFTWSPKFKQFTQMVTIRVKEFVRKLFKKKEVGTGE